MVIPIEILWFSLVYIVVRAKTIKTFSHPNRPTYP
jgi:hypothetical protein